MTRKQTVRNEIVLKMRYHLGKNELAMLDETLSECLYQVEIVDATTLPATFENSNEYILELYELKRSLVLKESTMRAYMGVARKLVRFSGSTCRQYNGDRERKIRSLLFTN